MDKSKKIMIGAIGTVVVAGGVIIGLILGRTPPKADLSTIHTEASTEAPAENKPQETKAPETEPSKAPEESVTAISAKVMTYTSGKVSIEYPAIEQMEDEEKQSRINPQVQEVLDKGEAYIKKIHASNDAIPGEVVSEKMSRMELLTKRIFARVEQNPEVVTDIRRLMEYYLPTAVKLLEAYEELDAQPVQGENILSSKKEIEDTLDTLNIAFEKLLDDLFQETAWDVSSDISVLKTMLAQEGLTKNDFSTGGK